MRDVLCKKCKEVLGEVQKIPYVHYEEGCTSLESISINWKNNVNFTRPNVLKCPECGQLYTVQKDDFGYPILKLKHSKRG